MTKCRFWCCTFHLHQCTTTSQKSLIMKRNELVGFWSSFSSSQEMQSGFMKPFRLLQKLAEEERERQISTCDYQQLSFLIWKLGYKPLCNNATRTIFSLLLRNFWIENIGRNQSAAYKINAFADKDKLLFLQNSIGFVQLNDFFCNFWGILDKFTEFQTRVAQLR